MTNIINLKSNNEWDILYESNNKLVVEFTASWCDQCQKIAPLFEKLSIKFKEIIFIKIDVDKFEEITQNMNITCVPTFNFIFNQKFIKKMSGSDEIQLKKNLFLLNEYLDNSSDSYSPEEKIIV